MLYCRYHGTGCTDEVTHYCEECRQYYCSSHALRHDLLIFEILDNDGIDRKYAVRANPVR